MYRAQLLKASFPFAFASCSTDPFILHITICISISANLYFSDPFPHCCHGQESQQSCVRCCAVWLCSGSDMLWSEEQCGVKRGGWYWAGFVCVCVCVCVCLWGGVCVGGRGVRSAYESRPRKGRGLRCLSTDCTIVGLPRQGPLLQHWQTIIFCRLQWL